MRWVLYTENCMPRTETKYLVYTITGDVYIGIYTHAYNWTIFEEDENCHLVLNDKLKLDVIFFMDILTPNFEETK